MCIEAERSIFRPMIDPTRGFFFNEDGRISLVPAFCLWVIREVYDLKWLTLTSISKYSMTLGPVIWGITVHVCNKIYRMILRLKLAVGCRHLILTKSTVCKSMLDIAKSVQYVKTTKTTLAC